MGEGDEFVAPRLRKLRVRNYRSIEGWEEVAFPTDTPLVLIGENNAGKSNVLRALTLVLGEGWPGSHVPEDHEFFGRSPEGLEIVIAAEVEGINCPQGCASTIKSIRWSYCEDESPPTRYSCESSGCNHTYMSKAIKEELTCMTVGVQRDLSWQLSYGSKWTALSKLMRKFHSRLIQDEQRVGRLKGFYDDLVSTFYEVEEFSDFAGALRAATADFGGNLPYGLDIDFSAYDASNFFRSLRIHPQLSGESRSYEELGTGQEQVLAMAFTYAYARAFGGSGLVLAVEEPEAHLHPLAQEWVAERLRALAHEGVQVVVTTHSPYFVELSRPGTTILVRKSGEDAPTVLTQLKPAELVYRLLERGAPDTVTSANVGPFYENSATSSIKAGLFARACVLVEGPTEEFALRDLLSRLDIDLVREGIAVIPVGGISNIAKWVRYFEVHGIPTYAVFDSDSQKTGKNAEDALRARRDILGALELGPESDWTDHAQGIVAVHERFGVFDPDFEGAARAVFGEEYESLEAEAAEIVGSAKPLVARYVARNLSEPEASEHLGWQLLRDLGERILATASAADSGTSD